MKRTYQRKFFMIPQSIAFQSYYKISTCFKNAILVVLLILAGPGIIPNRAGVEVAPVYAQNMREQIIVINQINVIPMTTNEILENKTVVIEQGFIKEIRDEPIFDSSPGVTIVDGRNHYLMPGLVDMHVHLNSKKDLDLFVANGVTTVQNMWGYEGFINLLGFSNQLRYRREIASGARLGPAIITAGPVLEGTPKNHPFMMALNDPKAAQKEVREQVKKGYDFLKVYDHLSPEVYDAIIQEAAKLQVPVKGHVPYQVGLMKAIWSGQRQVDHFTGYLDYDAVKLLVPENDLGTYARLAREHFVAHCPTMVFTQKRVSMEQFEEMARHPAMKYLNWMQRFFLRQSVRALAGGLSYQGNDYQHDVFTLYRTVILALKQEDAIILAGTDTGNPFVFPGFALHEELELLVKAGLSPFEALECATVNPWKSLNKINESGTVEAGKKADLLILRKNPLERIENTQEIESVILQGKLLNRHDLDELLR